MDDFMRVGGVVGEDFGEDGGGENIGLVGFFVMCGCFIYVLVGEFGFEVFIGRELNCYVG